jgi:phosphoglycolate phosphatase-like HAD superfamily hydrolase
MVEITKEKEFFVGIDSDGCVFDSMELKHKECFIPNFVNYYDLQGVSKYAREAAEFVNLYSKSRGCNRFLALVEQLDWLRRRSEVRERGVEVPKPEKLIEWTKTEKKLGNPTLQKKIDETGDPEFKRAMEWSQAVNRSVEEIVRNVPPFPSVRKCLEKLQTAADMYVVSATPHEALCREWEEHDIAKYVREICGQEAGSKQEVLAKAVGYADNHKLMIGDAPGDYKAAQATGCLFFPINPGNEEQSWKRLYEEGIDKFFSGAFAGDYQRQLLDEFDKYLPETPPWPVAD